MSPTIHFLSKFVFMRKYLCKTLDNSKQLTIFVTVIKRSARAHHFSPFHLFIMIHLELLLDKVAHYIAGNVRRIQKSLMVRQYGELVAFIPVNDKNFEGNAEVFVPISQLPEVIAALTAIYSQYKAA